VTDLRSDYKRFHRHAIATQDVDPVYPVYRALAESLGLSNAERAWLVFVHVAYYHAGSALYAFGQSRDALDASLAPTTLPVATERRAHWTRPRLMEHLNGLTRAAAEHGDLYEWARWGLPRDPREGWNLLRARLEHLPGNGRWASYKTAEMLAEIANVPVEAPDMGHADSSGPRHGLALLHPNVPTDNSVCSIALLDHWSAKLVKELLNDGLPATMATTETTLCDFHGLVKGRYYVGHDIDQMQHQLNQVPGGFTKRAFQARAVSLPEWTLGESNGRSGIQTHRNALYARTGRIEWWEDV
jgi:hypothetical protein